jgi:hypothetical protein
MRPHQKWARGLPLKYGLQQFLQPSSIDAFDAHVLPSQAPRACNGLKCRDAGWGLRRCSCALSHARKNVFATFDGGMWGLVRLPGTGCARREN